MSGKTSETRKRKTKKQPKALTGLKAKQAIMRAIFEASYTPVAPESYKPAEWRRQESCSECDGDGCANCAPQTSAEQIEEKLFLYNKQGFEKMPAATPVTVEAPAVEEIARRIAICEKNGTKWAPFKVAEIKHLLATPKPIGDVEARIRIIDRNEEPTCVQVKVEDDWYTVCKDINLDTALRVREVLKKFALSPFFAPQPPCSECATPQKQRERDLQHMQSEVSAAHSRTEEAEAECATLRKERDEAKRKLAVILDHSVRHDSYGVFGSDFSTCLFCDGGSSPGGGIFKHTDTCIVVTEKLESIVDDVFGELDENRRQLSAAEAQLSTLRDALKKSESDITEAKKDAQDWKREFEMYRDAWIRELGGWLFPKHHLIDALVLTTRARCVNPILGNCSAPHRLGKPTEDRKALQQIPHPQGSDCKEWAALDGKAVSRPSELGSHGEANLPRDAAETRQEKCSTALAPTPEVAPKE